MHCAQCVLHVVLSQFGGAFVFMTIQLFVSALILADDRQIPLGLSVLAGADGVIIGDHCMLACPWDELRSMICMAVMCSGVPKLHVAP